MKAEEYFDVVDENDQVIGQETRATVHAQNLLHRAVHILIFNEAGELLLQKRSPFKDLHPHLWVTSCSGHVDAGESYETACAREIHEELGLNPAPPLEPLFKLTPCEETGWEFVWIYRGLHNGPFHFQEEEISEVRFFPVSEINNWIQNKPQELTPSFHLIWKKYKKRAYKILGRKYRNFSKEGRNAGK